MTTSPSLLASFAGVFELHLTVDTLDPLALARFARLCGEHGVKPVVIEAPGAHMARQPMTSSYLRGTGQQAAARAGELAAVLRQEGFAVVRTKIEATLGARGLPEDDVMSARCPDDQYFEFHAKVALPASAPLASLRQRCLDLGAHLSTNALRVQPSGLAERFITLRAHRVGRPRALARFARLIAALRGDGLSPGHFLHEYTVLDTHGQLDHGWSV